MKKIILAVMNSTLALTSGLYYGEIAAYFTESTPVLSEDALLKLEQEETNKVQTVIETINPQ